jgi:hypothetical protein
MSEQNKVSAERFKETLNKNPEYKKAFQESVKRLNTPGNAKS